MVYVVLGVVVALNFILVKVKMDKKRWEDAVFDVSTFLVIMALFGGSYGGLIVGSVASLCLSVYFYANPPTFFSGKQGFLRKFISRAKRKGGD